MTKLRVLHCLETVGSGGVEQRRLLLAQRLDKARYEQALICTKSIGGLPEQFATAGVLPREIGVFRNIFDNERYAKALKFIREFKPDIIHGAVYEGVAVAALAGRWARVPIIIGEETSDPSNRRLQGHLLFRALASLTHNMVAVSPAVQDYLVRTIRLPASKVTLINNGVVESVPASAGQKQALRAALGVEAEDFIIGSCGRLLDEHKRFSDLIRAFAKVREQCPKTKLLIVGDGPDEAMLRALARQVGVEERVLFTGYQGDTRPYYEIMDIFALASAREAFGLVLVEAMFSHLPVVATHVGGIPSIVDAGETGYLVDPANPTELAAKLIALINDAPRRKSMGETGLLRARARFGADRYVRQVDELYQRLAAERLKQ
jgi:glycosyltransferase involved in cell wall biosynthesis